MRLGVVGAVEVDVVIVFIRNHMKAGKKQIHVEPARDIESDGIIWTDRAQTVRSPALATFHAAICDMAALTLIETRNNCED